MVGGGLPNEATEDWWKHSGAPERAPACGNPLCTAILMSRLRTVGRVHPSVFPTIVVFRPSCSLETGGIMFCLPYLEQEALCPFLFNLPKAICLAHCVELPTSTYLSIKDQTCALTCLSSFACQSCLFSLACASFAPNLLATASNLSRWPLT